MGYAFVLRKTTILYLRAAAVTGKVPPFKASMKYLGLCRLIRGLSQANAELEGALRREWEWECSFALCFVVKGRG